MLRLRILARLAAGAVAAAIPAFTPGAASAQSGEPIKIGFSMALTGPLAANGKQALLGMKIWEEEVNAKGGLIGRPVKLVYYDDQSNPSTVPGIYTKLLDVDKVDLVISGYATNMVAPAMPVVMQRKKTFIGLFGVDVNGEFKYPNYFSVLPTGPNTKEATNEGFFQVAAAQNPKPTTVAVTSEDAEFSRNAAEGARLNAKKYGFKIVYDRSFPPGTTDFSSIVRALQASNADIVVVCSYPLSSVGIALAVHELNYKPKMIGGAMVGLQATVFKQKLGSKMNGFVNYETWVPTEKMMAPAAAFFKTYQSKAGAEGVDPLGYYMAPWGYAQLQVLQAAIEGTKSLDDAKLGDYLRANTFKTVVGDVKFGDKGEWAQSRVLQIQFQHVKGNDIGQFKDISTQVVLTPEEYASGSIIYPYEKAK